MSTFLFLETPEGGINHMFLRLFRCRRCKLKPKRGRSLIVRKNHRVLIFVFRWEIEEDYSSCDDVQTDDISVSSSSPAGTPSKGKRVFHYSDLYQGMPCIEIENRLIKNICRPQSPATMIDLAEFIITLNSQTFTHIKKHSKKKQRNKNGTIVLYSD